ncbi:unnamed protein product [Prorocentrum cordatum]|uniref:Mannosyltransferase n=1 Tax=Prorocentrum cordatum TaxID=2364126 RepID=A0ABN9V6Y6_9DINO|nr:unnamed protein product [Polarella glacialis]|mmetsp:Transcript_9593/g.26190  ORF Transcript_9593/g.26190 Transcript_9593/m.26190 type:complete len:108 (+) Transcript_9593:241-564(+)
MDTTAVLPDRLVPFRSILLQIALPIILLKFHSVASCQVDPVHFVWIPSGRSFRPPGNAHWVGLWLTVWRLEIHASLYFVKNIRVMLPIMLVIANLGLKAVQWDTCIM